MPPHKEPCRIVRSSQPSTAKLSENSFSPEVLETIQYLNAVKEQEDQLLSLIGTYESDSEVKADQTIT